MTRRILFCTIGQTPQVVTETVWALREEGWVPDEIHIVTTTFRLARVRNALQHPRGKLAPLFDGALPPVHIHIPARKGRHETLLPMTDPGDWSDGDPMTAPAPKMASDALADVGSLHDNVAMGNLILRLMAGLVRDDDSEVHVSLAGGRKTMSAHALLAMTLVGRPQDTMSHVLVSPEEFEDHFEFWHPAQGGEIRRKPSPPGKAAGDPLDPSRAKVTLIRTPTPLIRYEVEKFDALTSLDLGRVVERLNLAAQLNAAPQVRLEVATNTLSAGGTELRLSAKLFAMYRLIATATLEAWPGVSRYGTGPGHAGWLSVPQICFGTTPFGQRIEQVFLQFLIDAVGASKRDNDTQDNKAIKAQKSIIAIDPRRATQKWKKLAGSFGPSFTHLVDQIRERFGAAAAQVLAPVSLEGGSVSQLPEYPEGAEKAPRYGLRIRETGITIA